MQKFMQTLKTKKDSMLESIKNKEGFTLIELIVVMAILAILVLLAAPQFLGYTKDANATAVRQDVKVLSDAALHYHINTEGWPVAEGNVVASEELEAVLAENDVLAAIDENALSNYIKNTKNDISKYALITDGDNEGSVVHLDGVEDKDKNTIFGIGTDFVVKADADPVDGE